jgi:hypothetical protein
MFEASVAAANMSQLNTSRIGESVDLFGVDLNKRDAATATTSSDGGLFASATAAIGGAASTISSDLAQATKCSKSKSDDNGDDSWLDSIGDELHNLTCSIEQEIDSFKNWMEDEIKDGINSLAQILGVHDFYSAHIMTFCEGYYLPGPVPNDTVKAGTIHKNVTACSNKTAMFTFDPRKTLVTELNESTNGLVDLSDLHWPEKVDDGLAALKAAQRAVFVLYCVSIALIFVAMIMAAGSILSSRRLIAAINCATDSLAFIAIVIASALVTYIAEKATSVINKYGADIGVSADRGNKFLALTWAASAAMFIAVIVWIVAFFSGDKSGRTSKKHRNEPKYG